MPIKHGQYRRYGNGEADIDFCDPADLPRSSFMRRISGL
jgi:hypothetical protein